MVGLCNILKNRLNPFVLFRFVQSVPACRGEIPIRRVVILFNILICGINLNMIHMW